jgi:hypothetical protein
LVNLLLSLSRRFAIFVSLLSVILCQNEIIRVCIWICIGYRPSSRYTMQSGVDCFSVKVYKIEGEFYLDCII